MAERPTPESMTRELIRKASMREPSKLPLDDYFECTNSTLTIFQKPKKSEMHFILLPRIGQPHTSQYRTVENLRDIYTWLNAPGVPEEEKFKLIDEMVEGANIVINIMEEEMKKTYGYRWGIHIGFGAAPSIHFLHVHILSDDYVFIKSKEQWNKFDPEYEYFVGLDVVLTWFWSKSVASSSANIRNRNLIYRTPPYDCHHKHCDYVPGSFAELKRHLVAYFKKEQDDGKRTLENRARREREREAKEKAKAAKEAAAAAASDGGASSSKTQD